MKRIASMAVALASVVSASALGAEPSKTPLHPTMARIREALPIPNGWHCEADHKCMVISRREPVTIINLISLPGPASDKEVLKAFGRKTHFQIVLLFLPRLSQEELRELRAVRTRAIERALDQDDPKRSRSARAARKVALPIYHNQGSSIYIYRTDDGPTEIYPKEAAAERNAILQSLDKLFERY